MIKLQDFAIQQGVTDRQVQRLLKKYASELEGKYERKGPNGTWLSEEACELLRGKMKQAPPAVWEEDPRVKQLEEKLAEVQKRLDDKEKLLALAQENVQKAQERVLMLQDDVGRVKALEEGKRTLEGKIELLEADNEAQRVRIAETEKKAAEDVQKAQKALAEAHDQFETELDQVKKEHTKEIETKDEKIQELENRTLGDYLKGLFRKKEKKYGQAQ